MQVALAPHQPQRRQPQSLGADTCFGFIGLPQQVMLHSLQVQDLVMTTSAPQLSQ